jgi:hypothetical protein
MHRDIAHPINPAFREIVQSQVIEKFRAESELAKSPDYTPADIDAEYEEKVVEIPEDTGANYAPSEYDQLIAGLNKGATQESPRERETRPVPPAPTPRAPRQNDRHRSEHNDRSARPARNGPPRQTQKADSRRSESSRSTRNHGSNIRPARPLPVTAQSEAESPDEVNGNIAQPDQQSPPPVARRPAPSRRVEERPPPRRAAEERPVPRKVEDPPVERRMEEPAARRVEAPPVQRPSPTPPAPQKKAGKMEDLPFGAGL